VSRRALGQVALLALLAGTLGAARAPEAAVSDGRYAMGTVLELTLRGPDPAAGRALLERLYARSESLERLFSNYDGASAVSALNASAGGPPAPQPPELARLLRDSKRFSARTDGAFDVTVGPLVALWREAGARGRLPAPAELAAARARVGSARIRVEGDALALAPGTAVELGGVAKGFALDRLAEDVRAAGVVDALLSFGQSSVVALGRPEGADAWRLLLRDAGDGFAGAIALRDQALSVSATLGQWTEIEGRRIGHLVDPRTGEPVAGARLAAVVAPSGAEAEVWSKALLVLGSERGLPLLAAQPGVEALLVDAAGARAATPRFAQVARFEALPGPHPLGPAPRGADGRYRNFADPVERGGPSVVLPFFARRVLGFLRSVEGVPAAVPDALAELAHHSEATVTWVNHATVLVHHDGVRYLTDPAWSGRAGPGGPFGGRRLVAPALAIADLPPVDFVLVSHNHYDHLDLPALAELARLQPRVRFLVPLGNAARLRAEGITNVSEHDWGERVEVGGVAVHCLPSQHWSRRGLTDENAALWSSWAVVGAARRVYFGGDTGLSVPMFAAIGRALGPFDLAALPIGAYEPAAMMRAVHLNPEEAVDAARLLDARRILGIHWGSYDLTDEPIGEPPLRFLAAVAAAGLGDDQGWVFRIGETREF
jgi:N-acyl-phosphatidylethanolamine-hydrolysing phospholipase D